MRFRMYEERSTSAAANISIAEYPKDVRESLFSTVKNLNWESAFFRLPDVDIAQDAGVASVDLGVMLNSGAKSTDERNFNWKPEIGWVKTTDSKPVNSTVFALLGEGFTGDALKNATYKTTYRFTVRGKNQSYEMVDRAFSGSRPLTTPTQGIDVLKIDASNLIFSKMEDAGKKPEELDKKKKKLLKVTVVIDSNQDRPIQPIEIQSNGIIAAKPISVILVNPKYAPSPSPVSIKITFKLSDGTVVNWAGNSSDLRKDYPDLDITLVDAHWDPSLKQ